MLTGLRGEKLGVASREEALAMARSQRSIFGVHLADE
ncbi:hypothetical protein NSS82_24685 [Paenibacillus sp. FSL H7-0735]|nr:hypothetical protein [Paenibacillus odorifer]